jgi:Immunoglobulin domain
MNASMSKSQSIARRLAVVSPLILTALTGQALAQCEEPKWVQMNVPGPSARTAHAMAWDDLSQQVILFGGSDINGDELNDTWAWNGSNWTRLTLTASPSVRRNHAMGTWAGRAAIFGGTTNGFDTFSELWILFGNRWTQIITLGTPPTGRAFHNMATLGSGNSSSIIIMGGTTGSCSAFTTGFRLSSGAQWSSFTPPNNLGVRSLAGIVSIEGLGNNDFAMLQGNINACSGTPTAGATVWHNAQTDAYNLVQSNPPSPARWNFAHASSWNDTSTPRKGYVMFGGDRGQAFNLLADTWHTREITPGVSFATLPVPGPAPSARRNSNGMAWDMARDHYVMFGGNNTQNSALGDTWVLTFKPIFTSVASNRNLCVGTNATFTVAADGPGTITYQWFYNNQQIVNGVQASGMFITGANTASMTITNVQPVLSGVLTCVATNGCGSVTTRNIQVATSPCTLPCGPIDFNGNSVYPEDQDVIDFFNVLAGAACPTNNCYSIDFNGNNVFPEDQDVISFFRVLAGGNCN